MGKRLFASPFFLGTTVVLRYPLSFVGLKAIHLHPRQSAALYLYLPDYLIVVQSPRVILVHIYKKYQANRLFLL